MDDSERIKVLLFSDADYTGGAEKYIYYLARYLPCRKHVVIEGDPGPDRLKNWLDGIEIPFTVISSDSAAERFRRLFALMRDIRPDILHINLPGPFDAHYSLIAPLAKAAGVNYVLTTEHLPMNSPFMKSRILKGFAARFIDCVITVSRDNRRHLIKKHKVPERKIRVIYNGIPDPLEEGSSLRESPEDEKGIFRVALVGSLLPKKGQKEAVEAIGRLDERIHLYLAGEGSMEEQLREMVKQYGLKSRVHFMGYVDDVFGFLSDKDLLLVPSSVEATPYTVIEGLAAGIPVIASNIYGIPEMIEDGKTGILIDRGGLEPAIRSMFENRSLLRDISREGRAHYESSFRVEKSVNETMSIYREVMHRGRPRE
ncbi:MAG: glycosyltransferase family 4 protein [Candidatus Krumholzibacteriales bacterium]